MATEPNGRSRVNWPTFFAGCGLVLTIGAVVVNALISQWTVQFSTIHTQFAHEREVTELKLKAEREHFEAELAKFQKEPLKQITGTQGK